MLLHRRCRQFLTVRHLTPPRHTGHICKSADERKSGCESSTDHSVIAVVETRAIELRVAATKVVALDIHEFVRKPCVKPRALTLVDASIIGFLCTSVASAWFLFRLCTKARHRSCLNHALLSRHILCCQRHRYQAQIRTAKFRAAFVAVRA